MKVELAPALEKLVRDKVASGLYRDESDVISDALRLLERQDRTDEEKLERLRTALEASRRDVADGRFEVCESDEEVKALFDRL